MKKFNQDIRVETRVFAMLTAATLAWVFGAASGALAAGPGTIRSPCMSLIFTR